MAVRWGWSTVRPRERARGERHAVRARTRAFRALRPAPPRVREGWGWPAPPPRPCALRGARSGEGWMLRAGSCCWCRSATPRCCCGGMDRRRYPLYPQRPWLRPWSTAWRWRCTARPDITARSAPRCARASATCRSTSVRCRCCCSAASSGTAQVARTRSRSPTSSFALRRSQRWPLVATIALIAAVPWRCSTGGGDRPGFSAARTRRDRCSATRLYVAALMALFAILFGTPGRRHRTPPGMMLAVALESVVKLIAGGGGAVRLVAVRAPAHPSPPPAPCSSRAASGLRRQTLLAFLAIFCLPRQFHVAIVNAATSTTSAARRW